MDKLHAEKTKHFQREGGMTNKRYHQHFQHEGGMTNKLHMEKAAVEC